MEPFRKLELLFVLFHHEPFFWDKSLLKLSTRGSPRGSEAGSWRQQHPGPRCTELRPAELPQSLLSGYGLREWAIQSPSRHRSPGDNTLTDTSVKVYFPLNFKRSKAFKISPLGSQFIFYPVYLDWKWSLIRSSSEQSQMSVSENSLCLALPWAGVVGAVGAVGAVGGMEKVLRCTVATPGSRYFRADMSEKTPVILQTT